MAVVCILGVCVAMVVAVVVADGLRSDGDSQRDAFLKWCLALALVAAVCTAVALVERTIRRRSRTYVLLVGAWALGSFGAAALLALLGMSVQDSRDVRNVLLLGSLVALLVLGGPALVVAIVRGYRQGVHDARRRSQSAGQ